MRSSERNAELTAHDEHRKQLFEVTLQIAMLKPSVFLSQKANGKGKKK